VSSTKTREGRGPVLSRWPRCDTFCVRAGTYACSALYSVTPRPRHTRSEAKQEVLTDTLPEEARLHWFGPRRDATQGRVLLFFYGALRLSTFLHIRSLKLGLKIVLFLFFLFFSGGGFSLPPRPDYFSFSHALQKDVCAVLGDVSITMLEYREFGTHHPSWLYNIPSMY
jgi:hypothetical protein